MFRRYRQEHSPPPCFNSPVETTSQAFAMKRTRSRKKDEDQLEPTARGPVLAALAVAIAGGLGMLIVDHGPWNKPGVQTAEIHEYSTTGDAAGAVGATVTPTEPKAQIEPAAPGPKPAQPAQPANPAPQ